MPDHIQRLCASYDDLISKFQKALTVSQTAVKGTKNSSMRLPVVRPELGTKRIDPETGRKFYDLNKDPIVSPYTGKTYPRSFFESSDDASISEDEDVDQKELGDEDAVEVVSLEDADGDVKVDDDVDLGDDDDTFLEDEEEEDDDVTGIINLGDDEDEI